WEAASRRVPARRIPACENLSQLAAHPGRLMAGLVDDGAGLVGEATFQAVETPLQLVDDRLDPLLEPLLELPGAGSQLRPKTAGLRLQLVAGAVQLTPQVLALRLQLRGQLPAPHLGPLEGEDPQPDRHVAGVANGLGHISHARERTGSCKQLQATGTASPRLNSRPWGHVG